MKSGSAVAGTTLMRRRDLRRFTPVLAWQLSVSAAFVALALRTVDVAALLAAAGGANWSWMLLGLLTFTTAKYIDSWRWRYLLRGVGALPQRALFAAFLIGNMANNALPFRLGDVAKIQVLANRYGASRAGLAASVFVVEASLDGAVFVLFLLVATLLFGLEQVSRERVALVAAAATLGLGVAVLLARIRGAGRLARAVPARWRTAVTRQLAEVRSGLHALQSWRGIVGALALSIPAWLVEAGMFALFGRAFGLDLAYPTFVAVMVAANLAVAVPVALWNFGPYEVLVVGVLVGAGVPEPTALSYALSAHLATSLWIQVTGLAAFWALGVRPRELLRGVAS